MSATLLLAFAFAADVPPSHPLYPPLRFERPASIAVQDDAAEEAEEEPPPKFIGLEWTGGVTAGLTVFGGNTRSSTSTLSVDAEGNGERSRFKLGASYIAGRTKDDGPEDFTTARKEKDTSTTARSVTAEAKYDYFLTEDRSTYAYTNALAVSDGVRDLNLLWSAGAGLGYQLLDKEERAFLFFGEKVQSFRLEAGLAYTKENFKNSKTPPTPPDSDTDYIAARAAFRYDVVISDSASAYTQVEWIPSLEDFEDDQLYRSKTGLRTKINGNLNAEATVLFDYDTSPAGGFGRQDVVYIFGLNWSF